MPKEPQGHPPWLYLIDPPNIGDIVGLIEEWETLRQREAA